eukprot:814506-Ditylum_brightwellii.AAC.1
MEAIQDPRMKEPQQQQQQQHFGLIPKKETQKETVPPTLQQGSGDSTGNTATSHTSPLSSSSYPLLSSPQTLSSAKAPTSIPTAPSE